MKKRRSTYIPPARISAQEVVDILVMTLTANFVVFGVAGLLWWWLS